MAPLCIIPAIDMIDGKCVRLTKGDYSRKKVYNEDPLEVAREFADNGIRRLHLVDLDGARQHHIVNYRILEKIASKTPLEIDFGGGIKSDEDLMIAFENGASMVTGGSIAVSSPETFERWLKAYSGDRIILGADAKDGRIAISGWEKVTSCDLFDFIEGWRPKGIKRVICTDISKDGMMEGPAVGLYKKLIDKFPDTIMVASGGVSSPKDLDALQEAGVTEVIVGKALYEGTVTLKEISKRLC